MGDDDIHLRGLSFEEENLLRQCRTEATVYRALPMAIGGMLAVPFLVNRGMITRDGLLWKVSGVGMIGFSLGRLSYIGKCRQKLLTYRRNQERPPSDFELDGSFIDEFGEQQERPRRSGAYDAMRQKRHDEFRRQAQNIKPTPERNEGAPRSGSPTDESDKRSYNEFGDLVINDDPDDDDISDT